MERDVAPIFVDVAKELGFLTAEQAGECKKAMAEGSASEAQGAISQLIPVKNLLSRTQIMAIKDEMRQRGVWPPLPGYELLERLGEGSMGAVYKARQVSLDRVVALKLLAPRFARDADYIKRFRREARLAAKLSHPNSVHIYNVEENARRHYIVMEFVDGADVARLIAKGPTEEKVALDIVRGVAQALGAAHEHGIIHRDIKPSNILLTRKGVPKLSDLGLAKQVGAHGSLTEHGVAVGTPFYMSPEQCRGDRLIDGRADIYSLGATLFHMVCGRPPFSGPGTLSILNKHVTEPLPDPRTLNPRLSVPVVQLIQRMTEKFPEARLQSCAELVKEAERIAGQLKDRAGASTVTVPMDLESKPADADEQVAPTTLIVWKSRKRRVTVVTPNGETKETITYFTNSIGMRLVLLPAGVFMMGSPEDENGHADDERPVHRVRISQSFYMSAHEVTRGQYKAVMEKSPSQFKGADGPVECVSWHDAKKFCDHLSEREGIPYRLPTEAEWEYACRAGTKAPFSFGVMPATVLANYDGRYLYGRGQKSRYRGRPTLVGRFPPNAWGLYDMHGNVWEWCEDWYDEHYYATSPENNPQGPPTGRFRVLRGGSWLSLPGSCRSATRYKYVPTDCDYNIGFRVVCVHRS